MKVSMIGTGYVGLVSGTCFAEMGHEVTCIDVDERKIKMLKEGKSPIYEPGLTEMIVRNAHGKRLLFASNYASVGDSPATFLAVGTPASEDGKADLTALFLAAKDVAMHIKDGAIIVIKSTVPVGTAKRLREYVASITNKKFSIVNNPEFLKEGSAINDFMRPDRVIIGYDRYNEMYAGEIMDDLYAPLVLQGNPIYHMSNLSAEMTKYAANSFLATKISFINDIARLCDLTGADIEEVRRGITSDKRIGPHFLYPGPGYGGSCFPKDVQALMSTAAEYDHPMKIVRAAHDVNNEQKFYLFKKLMKHFGGDIKGKVIAMWGVAFKPNTDDIRESPALTLVGEIVKAGGIVRFYDPIAAENFISEMREELSGEDQLTSYDNKYDCLNGAAALMLVTEWPEFRAPDFMEIKQRLATPVLIDGRNLYPTSRIHDHGIHYYAVGKYISKDHQKLKSERDVSRDKHDHYHSYHHDGGIGSAYENWHTTTELPTGSKN
ncbi:MAG: UDP-glucose/GDP-mannose dehydrogenase family protein [Oligoflexia bacterium]|nr:UDP-glucose/GDP-mannose dehydrogenase family protein [Oligoflexia bacterium]MBF0367305.1 UDP-glucose/GDP-mannose dehydrogenase family protein [Oligoflexia bacterium]